MATGLISRILPSGDDGGIKRALDLFLSLCIVCAVLSPLSSMISRAREEINGGTLDLSFPEVDVDADRALLDSLAWGAKSDIERLLRGYLCEELELSEDCLEVEAEVTANAEGVILKRVTVRLYGAGAWADPRKIVAIVARYTDAECVIV